MISLVVTTKDRSIEIQKLFASLISQTYKGFEVIVVDQSENDTTLAVVQQFSDLLPIRYFKTDLRGASRGKNIGISNCNGEIVGFPDDDCWYKEDTLEKINDFFKKHSFDLLSVPVIDPDRNNIPIMTFLKNSQLLNMKNVWHGGVVAGIFCRRSYVKKIQFDDFLGVGSGTIYESGEETDFLIRGIGTKFTLYFCTDIQIYHPLKDINIGKSVVSRNYRYGAGLGKVLRKNDFSIPTVLKSFIRPLGGGLLYFLKGNILKSKAYFGSFWGRITGYFF